MKNIKNITLSFRVSEKEAEHIKRHASKCGLSRSEYARQLVLGYEPRALPPPQLFHLMEKIDTLHDIATDSELHGQINAILTDIRNVLILPERRT